MLVSRHGHQINTLFSGIKQAEPSFTLILTGKLYQDINYIQRGMAGSEHKSQANILSNNMEYLYYDLHINKMIRPQTSKNNIGSQRKISPEQDSSSYQINLSSVLKSGNAPLQRMRENQSENYEKNDMEDGYGEKKRIQLVRLLLRYQLEKMGFKPKEYEQLIQKFILKKSEYLQIPVTQIKDWVNKTKGIIIQHLLIESERIIVSEQMSEKVGSSQSDRKKYDKIGEQTNNQLDEDPRMMIFCSICYLETRKYLVRKCEHNFCQQCMKNIILQNMEEGIFIIPCPQYNCQQPITDAEATKLLRGHTLERYLKFKHKYELQNNPNNKFCPKPDCEGLMIVDDNRNCLKCQNCKTDYCPICNEAYHPGKQCNETILNAINHMYDQYEIKRCPNCCSPIQKISGCNHMTCKKCKTDFCWICLKQISEYHYRIYNCCGCPAMQFDDPEQLPCRRLSMVLFYLLLPVLLALSLGTMFMLLPFYMLYWFLYNPCKWMEQKDNPKLELRIVQVIFFCNCCLSNALRFLFGFILFLPRSILFMIFIAPIKYFIGVYEMVTDAI